MIDINIYMLNMPTIVITRKNIKNKRVLSEVSTKYGRQST
jgi:hypothetical protein